MAKTTDWDQVIDWLQTGLVWFVIIVTVVCTCTLILFDVLVGAGSMYFLTQNNAPLSIAISAATTGLLMALMFIAYQLTKAGSKPAQSGGYAMLFLAFLVYCVDVYFDSKTADIFRFGSFISTKEVDHNMFRALLGGISTIGEAMAIAIIIGMPVLKTIINNAIPESYRRYQSPTERKYEPARKFEQSARTVPDSIRAHQQTTRPAPKPRSDGYLAGGGDLTFHPVNFTSNPNEESEG